MAQPPGTQRVDIPQRVSIGDADKLYHTQAILSYESGLVHPLKWRNGFALIFIHSVTLH